MTNPDDLGNFRPRIGKRLTARERVASSSLRVGTLVRLGHGWSGRTKRQARVPVAPEGFGPRHNARRVIIKAHLQRLTRYGAQAAARHLRYIEREGVEKDGSQGMLYGPEGPVQRDLFEQPRIDERHQFRFIVSPEDGADLDLTDYVRKLMVRVERDLGRSVEWAAVNHYDTEHPHAHIVVRGVDREGGQLRILPAYIARGFRWSAQDVATELLGPRLELEIRRAREREVSQERFTSLDRELERVAIDGRVDAESLTPKLGAPERALLVRRLKQLENLGVAVSVSDNAWVLTDGWQAHLRGLGERGDILKQVHRAIDGGDPERFHVVGRGQRLPDGQGGIETRLLVGRVARKGLADEQKGTFYAVLDTATGEAYHVPVGARVMDKLRLGELVSFQTEREPAVRPMDRQIAELAARQGGAYVLGREGERTEDERKTAVRLRELERLGVVSARAPGQWSVPTNFLEQLETRQREAPARYKLSIEPLPLSLEAQVGHRGPVWLDILDQKTISRAGFGAEVRCALERRRQSLVERGIAPSEGQRGARLQESERRAIGRNLAQRTGQEFLETIPSGFRGRVQLDPEGAPYLRVSDGPSFVLVRATPQTRALKGRAVEVSCDAHGGFVGLRARDIDRGR
jgi:type IV secretory pathway VirD2 relaxase